MTHMKPIAPIDNSISPHGTGTPPKTATVNKFGNMESQGAVILSNDEKKSEEEDENSKETR